MKKVLLYSSFSVLVISISLMVYLFCVPKEKIDLLLNGDNPVLINVFDSFTDPGVILKSNNNLVSNDKYQLSINSDLITSEIGNYSIDYNITYKNNNLNITRNVQVVDKVKPEITISASEVIMDYCTKKIKGDISYSAYDNYDGDITNNIEIINNEDNIVYKVSDSSGNSDEKIINIKFESKPNDKYYLKGSSKMYVVLNTTFTDPGAIYTDGCGKQIVKDITVSGEVDTSKEGTYFLTYTLEGQKTLTREVVVHEQNYQPKNIYLTFDDGPGAYTQKILDTLNKYNIKATFFVTHQFANYMYMIGEEYSSGHTVAVHTYTHNYKTVYTTVDGYISDFNQMNEIIKEYTGSYSNIFRFPGGSSNTVSRSYGKGIVTQIANEMTSRGYYYFDWNVDSQDAAGANQSKVYSEVVNGVERCTDCVVLMHDIKLATANALDDILNTLSSKGYTFKTLNASSPAIRHRINN